jgi:thiamine-monophosphate kinase
MLLEGSCFTLEGSPIQAAGVPPASPYRVGRKCMAVNLSDLAAMAAIPRAAVISVGLPRRGGRELAEELYRGARERADQFGVAIVGGDTNTWDGPLVVSVAVLGQPGPGGVIRRSGARAGDWLMVTGPLGGSIQGRHLDFLPRVREALDLASQSAIHAMIDLSDGLAMDLPRLCAESGVGAVIERGLVPCHEGVSFEGAIGDGEDYELLLAVSPEDGAKLAGKAIRIGQVVEAQGAWLDEVGNPLPRLGWEHSFS